MNGRNLATWFESLIRVTDSNLDIKGLKSFMNDFTAENGISIDTLNDINLKDVIKNIVTINGDVTFYGNLVFDEDLNAETVALRGNLTTDNISGCFLKEWMLYNLYTDQNIKFNGK